MKDGVLPTYQEINKVFKSSPSKLNPSQVHGLICGILSATKSEKPDWEKLIVSEKLNQNTQKILDEVYSISAKQLKEFQFELQLVLPPDKEPLPFRAECLTLWAQGFLSGLKIAQIPITNREPSDITEAIDDLIEVAKMNYESVMANEEDEQAYVELVEYMRMAIILIYQELQQTKSNQSTH